MLFAVVIRIIILVAHFIGSIYHLCICGYYVFLLLIVGSVLFIAAGYVAYPKWFKSRTDILKNLLKALPLWISYIYC